MLNFYDILSIAENYEEDIEEDRFDTEDMKNIFEEIIKDYKKLVKKCKRQGIDIGKTDEQKFEDLFNDGSIKEKNFAIDNMQERIKYLLDICEFVPIKIKRKYRKDLVDRINDGDMIDED